MTLGIKLLSVRMGNCRIVLNDQLFDDYIIFYRSLREKYQDIAPSKVDGVMETRALFKSIGLDPTKRRASSESLLRRVLKDKPLYSVNNIVDLFNWFSLQFQLPICLYDRGKIDGEIVLTIGSEGDSYQALNGELINFEDRFLFKDSLGGFGSPMTDSVRTSVDDDSKDLIALILVGKEHSIDFNDQFIPLLKERFNRYKIGEISSIKIFE